MRKMFFSLITIQLFGLLNAQTGKVGINTTTPQAMLHVKDSSVVFTGASTLPATPGNPPVSGAGTRMMWYPDKAAFRAGRSNGNNWDKDNIGEYSFAAGNGPKAQGNESIAIGSSTEALGFKSTALGSGSSAVGDFSIAIGGAAYGPSSTALNGSAFGNSSIAMGSSSQAVGNGSVAMGFFTKATGTLSVSMGWGTVSRPYGSLAMGFFNDSIITSSTESIVASDPVLMIGNGLNDNFRSNAFVILKNGRTGINTSSPDALLHIVRNGASGGGYNTNSAMIIESSTDAYIQLSNQSADESGILSGSDVSNLRSGIVFRADSAISFRAGGNDTKMLLSKTGDVTIDGELNRPATGTAHLSPICYGSVASNGVINSGTSNFTISNSATGQYDVTITGETYTNSGYVTLITVVGGSNFRIATTASSAGQIVIRIFDISGTLVNTAFHFVVYKQ
jgi:hypothetical protein